MLFLIDATRTHRDKLLNGFSIINVTGTCAKGISMAKGGASQPYQLH